MGEGCGRLVRTLPFARLQALTPPLAPPDPPPACPHARTQAGGLYPQANGATALKASDFPQTLEVDWVRAWAAPA